MDAKVNKDLKDILPKEEGLSAAWVWLVDIQYRYMYAFLICLHVYQGYKERDLSPKYVLVQVVILPSHLLKRIARVIETINLKNERLHSNNH